MPLSDLFRSKIQEPPPSSGNESTESLDATQRTFDLVLLSVRRLLGRGAITNLSNLIGRLPSVDIARVMSHLSSVQDKRTVFELVEGNELRGQVLSELDEETMRQVLEELSPTEIAWLLRNLANDDVADILGTLEEERAQEILPLLTSEESHEVAHLLSYPKGTAGSMMTTEYFSLPEDTIAEEALHQLQHATKAETVFYIYGTDHQGHLTGVISLRELLQVALASPLKAFLTRNPVSVTVDTDHKEVARQVANYNLLAIPVVDGHGGLVGIITVDDVIDVIQEEDTKDMLKLAGGVEEDAFRYSSGLEAVGFRLPWLFTNLLGSFVSGMILWYFRLTIQEVVAIVTFIPVIAAMGGNVGMQSSILIIRGLATGRVEASDLWIVLFRELRIGLLLGLICGTMLTLAGWMFHGGLVLGLVVGISLLVAFLVSTGMATITPILLKRFHIDPAVSAGPFVTTANDITGVTIYLSLATLMLDHLR
jgi:magnesium transporter